MRRIALIPLSLLTLSLLSVLWVVAQDETCSANLEAFYALAYDQCHSRPSGYLCNGGLPPAAEPSGPVSNSLAPIGSLVDYDLIDAVHSQPLLSNGSIGGLLWLRANAAGYSAMLVGDVRLRDTSEGLPWLALNVQTDSGVPTCSDAPHNALVIQSMLGNEPAYLTVNGASLVVSGSVLVHTRDTETLFLTLEGEARVQTGDAVQAMVAGQQIAVTYADEIFSQPLSTPTLPTPFDAALVRNLPARLMDRLVQLPQPGYAITEGIVNLRAGPSLDEERLLQVPPGQIMSVLGRNPAGDWYHVRLLSGETGWMFAELLQHEHGSIESVYASTPGPVQSEGQSLTGRVIAVNGIAVREQPFPEYNTIQQLPNGQEVTLVSRSPYGAWVKVALEAGAGWIPLVALDAQTAIAMLPVDNEVAEPEFEEPQPILPAPALEPGSWGNAFPDPNCTQDCGNG